MLGAHLSDDPLLPKLPLLICHEVAVVAKHFHAIQVTVTVAIAPRYRGGCVR